MRKQRVHMHSCARSLPRYGGSCRALVRQTCHVNHLPAAFVCHCVSVLQEWTDFFAPQLHFNSTTATAAADQGTTTPVPAPPPSPFPPFAASYPAPCLHTLAEMRAGHAPDWLQQQLSEARRQLETVQHRTAAKEASCRKYKEAVRAFKVCARPLCVQSYACLPAMQQQQHHFNL